MGSRGSPAELWPDCSQRPEHAALYLGKHLMGQHSHAPLWAALGSFMGETNGSVAQGTHRVEP